jgi:hypothetical protein
MAAAAVRAVVLEQELELVAVQDYRALEEPLLGLMQGRLGSTMALLVVVVRAMVFLVLLSKVAALAVAVREQLTLGLLAETHLLALVAAAVVGRNLVCQCIMLEGRAAHLATSPAALAARLMAHQQRFRAARA